MKKYKDQSFSAEECASDLLSRMTTEEKLAQINIDKHYTRSRIRPRKLEKRHLYRGRGRRFHVRQNHSYARRPGYRLCTRHLFGSENKNLIQRYMVEKTRLEIPCIFTAEALHGISFAGASIFPVPLTLSQTFNPELVKKIGEGIAAETRALGHHEILAPNLDVSRDPRWGRTE